MTQRTGTFCVFATALLWLVTGCDNDGGGGAPSADSPEGTAGGATAGAERSGEAKATEANQAGPEQAEPEAGAGEGTASSADEARTGAGGTLELTSTAFDAGGRIPRKHTCDGEDVSPPLSWSGAPEGTARYALIVDDPDAPPKTWVHWVLYGLPASEKGLEADLPAEPELDNGAMQGTTDFDKVGWGGPCPPPGHGTHQYHFKLYALDAELDLEPKAAKPELESAMEGHIVGRGELVGLYERAK